MFRNVVCREESCYKDGVSKSTPARMDLTMGRERDNVAENPGR
jgi:hypothetical protein